MCSGAWWLGGGAGEQNQVMTGVSFSFSFSLSLSLQALAQLVQSHLISDQPCSRQLTLRCPLCINPTCGEAKAFFSAQKA
jgi:hypothetical protein